MDKEDINNEQDPPESNEMKIDDDLIAAVNAALGNISPSEEISLNRQYKKRLVTEEQIHCILKEYLSGYVLAGYHATTGERIIIDYAETEALSDATMELLKVAVIKIMHGN